MLEGSLCVFSCVPAHDSRLILSQGQDQGNGGASGSDSASCSPNDDSAALDDPGGADHNWYQDFEATELEDEENDGGSDGDQVWVGDVGPGAMSRLCKAMAARDEKLSELREEWDACSALAVSTCAPPMRSKQRHESTGRKQSARAQRFLGWIKIRYLVVGDTKSNTLSSLGRVEASPDLQTRAHRFGSPLGRSVRNQVTLPRPLSSEISLQFRV